LALQALDKLEEFFKKNVSAREKILLTKANLLTSENDNQIEAICLFQETISSHFNFFFFSFGFG